MRKRLKGLLQTAGKWLLAMLKEVDDFDLGLLLVGAGLWWGVAGWLALVVVGGLILFQSLLPMLLAARAARVRHGTRQKSG